MKLNVPSKIHRSPLWKYRAYTLNTNRQNQTAASRTHIRQHCTFLCVYVLVMRLQPFTEALKAISLYRYIIDIIVRWFEVCCFYICLSVCLSFCVGRSSILIAISILCKMKIVFFVVVAADEWKYCQELCMSVFVEVLCKRATEVNWANEWMSECWSLFSSFVWMQMQWEIEQLHWNIL